MDIYVNTELGQRDEIYQNTELHGDDIYENRDALIRQNFSTELLPDYRESQGNTNSIDLPCYNEESTVNTDQLSHNEGVRHKFTGQLFKNNETLKAEKSKRNTCGNGCCCFLGFVIGLGLASAGYLTTYFVLLPYLESLSHATLPPCPKDWILYNKNCYYMSVTNSSWSEAQKTCTSLRSNLTDILDLKETEWLSSMAGKLIDDDVWVGGKGINGTNFKWQYGPGQVDPANLTFTYWASDQPSHSEGNPQNCMQLWSERNYRWDNEFCHKEKRFICKRKSLQV